LRCWIRAFKKLLDMADTPPVPETDVYAIFCGTIDQASAGRIASALAVASQKSFKRAHLLFQSSGGLVGDGIFLYGVFRSCPLDLALYNGGLVSSIAAIAWLGAKTRVAGKYSTFMFHRTTSPAVAVNQARLDSFKKNVSLDDERTLAILKEHSAVTAEQWSNLRDNEFWLSANDAISSGIATKEGEFSPPIGKAVYYI
jgi:ATP-dependent protease ClpP protease subunit